MNKQQGGLTALYIRGTKMKILPILSMITEYLSALMFLTVMVLYLSGIVFCETYVRNIALGVIFLAISVGLEYKIERMEYAE